MATMTNEWVDLAFASDSTTGNGSAVAFVTSGDIKSAASVFVTLNGLAQILNTHYTVTVATNTVTFTTAPANAQKINIKYIVKG